MPQKGDRRRHVPVALPDRDVVCPRLITPPEMQKEYTMCLSTVFMHVDNTDREIMRDVARVEAEGGGVWLTNLFGEKRFVEGTVRTIDLIDEHLVVLEPSRAG